MHFQRSRQSFLHQNDCSDGEKCGKQHTPFLGYNDQSQNKPKEHFVPIEGTQEEERNDEQ
jgi:hypothetical protein